MNSTIYIAMLLLLFGNVTWIMTTAHPKTDKGNSSTSYAQIDKDGATLACKCGIFGMPLKKPLNRNVALGIIKYLIGSNMDVSSFAYYQKSIDLMSRICQHCEILYTTCDENPNVKNPPQCKQNSVDIDVKKKHIYLDIESLLKFGMDKVTPLISEEGLLKFGKDKVSPLISGEMSRIIAKREVPIAEKDVMSMLRPVYVHVPMGGMKERSKRQTGTCLYPYSLQTSELNCIHYPSSVKCIQKCAMGHALRGGTVIEHNCLHKNDKWEGGDFKECKAYIDCGVTLISGGKASCSAPTLKEGPTCEIECNRYEDKDSLVVESSCDSNGKWSPALPFCAIAGTGMKLVDKNGNSDDESEEDEKPKEDDKSEEDDSESREDEKPKEDDKPEEDDSESKEDEKDKADDKENDISDEEDEASKEPEKPKKKNKHGKDGKSKKSDKKKDDSRQKSDKHKDHKKKILDDLEYYNDYEDYSGEDEK